MENLPNLNKVETTSNNNFKILENFYIGENVGTLKGFSFQPLIEKIWNDVKNTSNPNIKSIHVENIKWTDFSAEMLEWYCDIPTCEFKGEIIIKETNANRPAITWNLKNKFLKVFGNVDDAKSKDHRGLLLDYAKRPFDASAATISGNFFVDDLIVADKGYNEVEEFVFSVKPYSQYENSQTKIAFSVEGSGNYTMDADGTFCVRMYELSKMEQTAIIKANVSVIKNGTSVVESVSKEIEVWLRPAKVGDLVYYDGTFSSAERYDGDKTPIGECCYVAPRKADGSINEKFHNPLDKHTRLMAALDDIKASSDSETFTTWQWGAFPGAENNSLYSTDADGTKKELSLDGNTTIYDVPNVRNLSSSGMYNSDGTSAAYITDDAVRDESSDLGLENDGFKPINANLASGDGFAYNEPINYQNERKIDETILRLAGEGYANGDMVNSGYAKTLRVIAHRNNIINHCYNGSSINGILFPLTPIVESGGKSELDVLAQRITDIRNWAKSPNGLGDTNYEKWSQLYYPVVSVCYAYEPKVMKPGEMLASKFKKHNWFLPTQGLFVRLWWYQFRFGDTNNTIRDDSPFSESIRKGLFKVFSSSGSISVSEQTPQRAWRVNTHRGSLITSVKSDLSTARAVCAF